MSTPSADTDAPLLLAEHDGVQAYLSTWEALLSVVPSCDLLVVDAPYSAKTHRGHNTGTDDANAAAIERPDVRGNKARYELGLHQPIRRHLSYGAWCPADVEDFVIAWSGRVNGWMVTITDDVLAPVWLDSMERAGRYAFAPLPYVAVGSRVRLTGDGPSGWTTWIVVARPRTKEAARWGTLPGAYILPGGHGGAMPVVGGKPPWLMQRLIEDYSRPGDLVCDPCMGAGTSLVAAIRSGRRAVGGDMLREHAELAATWIRHPHRPGPRIERANTGAPQLKLLP